MKIVNELKIRLKERIRIYEDSPSVAATYVGLKHFVEDLLEILEDKEKPIGFNGNEE